MDDNDIELSSEDIELSSEDIELSSEDIELSSEDIELSSEDFQLATVGVEVNDRAAFEDYLESVVGMVRGESPDPAWSAWRLDAKCHRILVSEGPADDVAFASFECRDSASLQRMVDRLTAHGATPQRESDDLAALRQVQELVSVQAPWGVRLELVVGLAEVPGPFEAPLMPGGFVTGDLGLGHAVFHIAEPQLDEATQFVTDGLGMRLSDYLQLPGSSDRGDFYHSNGRHHSLAFVPLPGTRKLHHIMIETVSPDNVGMAFDRTVATGLPIPHGLGKHANDGMFGFYTQTPGGFQMEVGAGAVIVDDTWEVIRYDRVSSWGHQRYTPAPKPAREPAPTAAQQR